MDIKFNFMKSIEFEIDVWLSAKSNFASAGKFQIFAYKIPEGVCFRL